MIIAIDGPAGSGKGTIARRLADAFGLGYLDTGKLYRAVAVAALERGVSFGDAEAMAALAADIDMSREALNDLALRTAQAGAAASKAAAIPGVRAALLARQQEFARRPGGAILDGRDIGTVVCPHADVKLYVTASAAERARRRAAELRALGHEVDEAALAADLAQRDKRDAERDAAPMRAADDACLLDTTELSIDAAFEAARRIVEDARAKACGS